MRVSKSFYSSTGKPVCLPFFRNSALYQISVFVEFCNGPDHIVIRNKAVVFQSQETPEEISPFMGYGLITMMARTHQTVILTPPSMNPRFCKRKSFRNEKKDLHRDNFDVILCVDDEPTEQLP